MTETIEYSADENALKLSNGNLYVTENTKIMIAPTLDKDGWFICLPNELAEEDFALFDISMLTDGQRFYNAITYLADAEGNAEFVLVNSEVEMAEPVANMALVKSVGATENENYYPVYSIKALREGEEQTLYTIDDSMFIQQYSTILPTFDMNGKVKSVDVLATVVNNSSVTFNNPDSFATEDTKYYYGQLTEMSKRTITVGGEEISIPASANVYVYNSGASSSNRVSIDTIDIIDYDGDTFWCGRYQCNVYTVVRECKGEVIDVVLYILENEY